jgi:hypothetical protein
MKTIERIFQKINSTPSFQTKLESEIVGFKVSPTDRKNLMIMLRKEQVKFNSNIADNDLLRLYLSNKYKEHNQYVRLQKQKKRAEEQADDKVKKMLKILDEAEVKGLSEKPKYTRGYINLKIS